MTTMTDEINFDALEVAIRSGSERDVAISKAEDRVVEAAEKWAEAWGQYQECEFADCCDKALYKEITALLALREGK